MNIDDYIYASLQSPFSGKQLDYLVSRKAKISSYDDIMRMHNFDQLFDNRKQLNGKKISIILYMFDGRRVGHWACFIRDDKKKLIEFFDPYGNPVDHYFFKKRSYVKPKLFELLNKFLAKHPKYDFVSNPFPFQKPGKGISSCGRWVGIRILLSNFELEQFAQLFNDTKFSPDYYITILTLFSQ